MDDNQSAAPQQAAPAQQPQPVQYVHVAENPGQTLGIVGLVLNFLGITIGGIILGVMSRNKSRAAGMSTTLGTVSMVWGIVATALAVVGFIFFMIMMVAAAANANTAAQTYSTTSSY